jgi:hypothetical protein
VPCNTSAGVEVWLGGAAYALATAALIVPDRYGRCWGALHAWANGSAPETAGEIRLGAAFISGVYL